MWATDGTTGYEAMNDLVGLFVDGDAAAMQFEVGGLHSWGNPGTVGVLPWRGASYNFV